MHIIKVFCAAFKIHYPGVSVEFGLALAVPVVHGSGCHLLAQWKNKTK